MTFPSSTATATSSSRDRELAQHYEGKWTGNRRLEGMTIFPSLDGWSRSSIVAEGDEGARYWSTDADIWAEILDKIGLEGSVLYPTSGLAYGLMQSEEFPDRHRDRLQTTGWKSATPRRTAGSGASG